MFLWVENGEGLGAGTQLTGGVVTERGVFAGGDTSGVGNTTGEGVKKLSEGEGDGEYEGLSDGESDGGDEKG